ncbi:SLAP domain-containing protein [Lactobacillus melliventris]|uniref:S-layer protein C-terminal domain-containing protein n=1 Tax=Lactobacillus melliventris TaxID=1218507 RepID=A0A0F4LLT4_9LACO|nr:SLAP domain-containing protein [Lactobacillus melliventris]KJY58511.1 hypothetical protein JF74_01830 [Lactobacillus melliventris]
MKFFKKVGIGLAATVLTISPLLPSLNHVQTVQAAPKAQKLAKNRITLVNDAPVYNQYGQRLKARKNGNYSVIEPDVNGFCYVSSFDVDSLDYYGTIMINGQKYYKIGQGEYINDGDVNNVNGKSSKTGKLVLNHRSAIYTKTGKLKGKTLPVKSVVNYQGQVKQTQSNQKYYFAKFNVSEQKATFYYLPTATVNGKDCYAIGKNRYIRANNVDSIDGYPLMYNGVTYATVLKKTTTQTLTNDSTKHVLKKGQKIKVDLAVQPWAEDFEGYIYRLHDYPNEYVGQGYIKLRNYLPTSSYDELTFTYVKPNTTTNTKFYNFDGTTTGISYRNRNQSPLTVDGLYYIWVPSANKAELFYHFLTYRTDRSYFVNNDGTDLKKPEFDKTNKLIESTEDKIHYTNSFVKASDVTFASGIKLTPLNTAKDAENDQKVATDKDKQELQRKFEENKNNKNVKCEQQSAVSNYNNALMIASSVLQSPKATIAQVKQAIWLLDTTKIQLSTLNFAEWS